MPMNGISNKNKKENFYIYIFYRIQIVKTAIFIRSQGSPWVDFTGQTIEISTKSKSHLKSMKSERDTSKDTG